MTMSELGFRGLNDFQDESRNRDLQDSTIFRINDLTTGITRNENQSDIDLHSLEKTQYTVQQLFEM